MSTADPPSVNPSQVIRTVVVPDLDDELTHTMRQLEELLLTLDAIETDQEDPLELPAPLAGRAALDALHRIQSALRPTQTRTDRHGREHPPENAAVGRILGPDGRYEHRGLHLVRLDPADLATLAAAAQVMGATLAGHPSSDLAAAIAAGASTAADGYGPTPTGAQLVEGLARVHGLLDLADTPDTALLRERLSHTSPPGVDVAPGDVPPGDRLRPGDIVLTPAEEAAYHRLADRFNTMWTSSDGLARWLY